MLHMRDSEVCDPCLHFLFLFLLCFLRLMLGVAHGLVNMLVQELKELVDIPAISISRPCWYPCNGGISQLHSPPRQTFSSHELAWIANWGKLKQHSLKACRCWKTKELYQVKPVRNHRHIILRTGRRRRADSILRGWPRRQRSPHWFQCCLCRLLWRSPKCRWVLLRPRSCVMLGRIDACSRRQTYIGRRTCPWSLGSV